MSPNSNTFVISAFWESDLTPFGSFFIIQMDGIYIDDIRICV